MSNYLYDFLDNNAHLCHGIVLYTERVGQTVPFHTADDKLKGVGGGGILFEFAYDGLKVNHVISERLFEAK